MMTELKNQTTDYRAGLRRAADLARELAGNHYKAWRIEADSCRFGCAGALWFLAGLLDKEAGQ